MMHGAERRRAKIADRDEGIKSGPDIETRIHPTAKADPALQRASGGSGAQPT